MKFLHTSDWHLGRRLLSVDMLDFQRSFLDWLLDIAVAERVAAVLVAGDVYDRALPGVDSVELLDQFVATAAAKGVRLVIIPGNHDNAVRLRYGGRLFSESGVHVRGELAAATDPVLLGDEWGTVGVYGIPYLHPDSVYEELGAQRSHESVLAAVGQRIREDAAARGLTRTVLLAHAFVAGCAASDSEREIVVGGIGDTPARVFEGFNYVALGHLHGPQVVKLEGSDTRLAYSGSPLAYSFSERDHVKSVTLVELSEGGTVDISRIPAPVPRRLVQVTGELAELRERARTDLAGLADCFVKVVLTDRGRPAEPMAALRALWPHTLVLEFATTHADPGVIDLRFDARGTDPARIVCAFTEYVRGIPAEPELAELISELVSATSLDQVN